MLAHSARGLSAPTVRRCVAPRRTMCPCASSSPNTIVAVDARLQAWPPMHQVDVPEAQAAPGSLHMQQPVLESPIWAAHLEMVTRSSHSADAKPARLSRFDAGA
ncbi:hypothetical protein LA080_008158 [Diaporthe eres]|nr:hypothetical protein LA080_008158 [Diaporthe eres]